MCWALDVFQVAGTTLLRSFYLFSFVLCCVSWRFAVVQAALTAELKYRGARHRHLRLIRGAVLARCETGAGAADTPTYGSGQSQGGQGMPSNQVSALEMTRGLENRSKSTVTASAAAAVDPSPALPETANSDSLGDLPNFPVMNEWGEWDWSLVHRETPNAADAAAAAPAPVSPATNAGPGMIDVAPGNVAALVSLYACTGGVNWITRTG